MQILYLKFTKKQASRDFVLKQANLDRVREKTQGGETQKISLQITGQADQYQIFHKEHPLIHKAITLQKLRLF